jgi:transposase InsO family protein
VGIAPTAAPPPAPAAGSATTTSTRPRVLTDNAKAYAESALFTETAATLGIRLKRTRPYRPQTNGKVEWFNKTLLEEWAYARLYRSNTERRRAFTRWLRTYNHRRPHTALDGLTPMAVLVNNVHGKHT